MRGHEGVIRYVPRLSIFYGWWIVVAGALGMALSAGLNFYGFSAFFVPLTDEFGWSRTALSGVFSLSRLESGITGPIGGYATDKLGPRRVMLVGVPLMGLGFIMLSQVNSLLSLYLIYILLIAVGSGLGFGTPIAAAAANWFDRQRSLAFGLLWSGLALGGAILVPVVSLLISTYGWRTAAVVAGVMVWVLGIPIALSMRHRPEQYGYLPDGVQPVEVSASGDKARAEGGRREDEYREWGPMEAVKTSAFWFLSLSLSIRSIVLAGFVIHFIPLMTDRGMNEVTAGSLLGSTALLSIIGRLGLGKLGDMVSKQYIMAGCLAVTALSMLAMSRVEGTVAVMAILAPYAICYGGLTVLPLGLQADFFGRSSFATVRGLIHSVQTGGMIAGPLFAGIVYDTTDSYNLAFLGFAAASLLAMVFILLARPPAPQAALRAGEPASHLPS